MRMNRRTLLILLTLPLILTACQRRPVLDAPRPTRDLYAGAVEVWPAPENFEERIAAAGVPTAKPGEEYYHIHAHLEVFKDGRQVIVPANIGTAPQATTHSPLHTHQNTGVIHVEAASEVRVTLGQFFMLWNVPLDGAKAYVNDQPVPDPSALVLTDRQLVTVIFGDPPAHFQVQP